MKIIKFKREVKKLWILSKELIWYFGLFYDCYTILADWKSFSGNRRSCHCDSRRNADHLLLD